MQGKGKRSADDSLSQSHHGKEKKTQDVTMKEEDEDDIDFDEVPYEGSEDEWEEEELEEGDEDEDEEEMTEEQQEYWKNASEGSKKGEDGINFVNAGDGEDEEEEDDEDNTTKQVWRPGKDKLEEGEELDYDPSTYSMLHALSTQWPCLSFAFVPDTLGGYRTKYPHTLYIAAGTQAVDGDTNSIITMKISRLGKTIVEDSDSDEDSDEEEEYEDPILETSSFTTQGVNRVKVMPQQNKNNLIAMWSDTGKVHVYDYNKYITAVDNGSSSLLPKKEGSKYSTSVHKNEGFALDWSPTVMGRLLSGDCDKYIYETDFYTNTTISQPYSSHTASVEDVQWSPVEKEVFASCSVDKTVKIWDSRATARKAMITVKVHESDVNTLSWNKKVPYLLATGSDDCSFKIWDMRNFNKPDAVVAHFTYHEKPISCVEWNPHDDSQLVVVSEDDQVTIWDMGLEPDDGEEASEFPPQLFFVHLGQHEVKEAHWHPQIPNLIATTSGDGFNIFITANSTEIAPEEVKV